MTQLSYPADFVNRLEMRAPLSAPFFWTPVALRLSTPKCCVPSDAGDRGISITQFRHPNALAICVGWLARDASYAVVPIEPCNTTRRAVFAVTLEFSVLRIHAKTPHGRNCCNMLQKD